MKKPLIFERIDSYQPKFFHENSKTGYKTAVPLMHLGEGAATSGPPSLSISGPLHDFPNDNTPHSYALVGYFSILD